MQNYSTTKFGVKAEYGQWKKLIDFGSDLDHNALRLGLALRLGWDTTILHMGGCVLAYIS